MSLPDKILAILAPHRCIACGCDGSLLCTGCAAGLEKAPPGGATKCLDAAYAATVYTGAAKELIWRLKYDGARAAARTIAGLIKERLPDNDFLLVPVPTTADRVRQRGYDQAVLIARELSRLTGYRCAPLLRRRGRTHQVGASRQQRLRQTGGMFRAARGLPDADILLIDDVLTTGATLESAAESLRRAGAGRVCADVFARV